MFGDQKPKAAAVNVSNKKQNVKTAKVKAPVAPGSGRKATKTEIWDDPNPGKDQMFGQDVRFMALGLYHSSSI